MKSREIDILSQMNEFQAQGITVRPRNYEELIICHCNAGDISNAMACLNAMKSKGMKPSEDTYFTLIRACAKTQRYAEGLKAAEQLRAEFQPQLQEVENVLSLKAIFRRAETE